MKKIIATIVLALIAIGSIPADAKRCHGISSRKNRAEFAKVLEIEGGLTEIHNPNKSGLTYRLNEIAMPDKYTDDIRIECGHGINFFINRQEAVDY
jgi:hypothetical protein